MDQYSSHADTIGETVVNVRQLPRQKGGLCPIEEPFDPCTIESLVNVAKGLMEF